MFLIQCCRYIYTNYSPAGTCNPGINRGSFSIRRSCSTPALRMDLVIPPGPGPTSQTWAFFSSPACFTILSARHKEHTKPLFSRRSSSLRNSLFIVQAQVCLSQNRYKQCHIPVKWSASLHRIHICFILQTIPNYLKKYYFQFNVYTLLFITESVKWDYCSSVL